MAAYLLMLSVGVVAGVVGGVLGTGSSMLLVPLLVWNFGPKQAVAVMAVASVVGNASRVAAWWRLVDIRACLVFSLPAIPAVALGSQTMLALPESLVNICLGLFFLLLIPYRRWARSKNFTLSLQQLAVAGLVIGYISGVVTGSGPLSVAAFSAYGLLKGAFISTEAAASFIVFFIKAITFRTMDALSLNMALHGLILGGAMMTGTFLSKQLLLRMNPDTHQALLDGMLFVSGLALLWAAFS